MAGFVVIADVDARLVARCTLGYMFALSLLVLRDGWTASTELTRDQIICRIALWHQAGIGGAWS